LDENEDEIFSLLILDRNANKIKEKKSIKTFKQFNISAILSILSHLNFFWSKIYKRKISIILIN